MHVPFRHKIAIARASIGPAGTPRFASLFITRRCNLTCDYCRSIQQKSTDIDLKSWQSAINKLHSFGCRIFSLTGGEPLLRPDITDIIHHITFKCKAVCGMISNFSLMNEHIIDSLVDAGLQFLTCSLDSLKGEMTKSNSNVLELLSYAKSRGIIVSTLTVITRKNIDEVPAILTEVQRYGIIFDMGLYQHVGGLFSPDTITSKVTDCTVLNTLRKQLLFSKLRTGLVSPSWNYLTHDISSYIDSNWKCSIEHDSYLVINNNGNLMICQEYGTDISIFDIETLSDSRWRSEKQRTISVCNGCFYGCYYQKEHIGIIDALFNIWTMLRI